MKKYKFKEIFYTLQGEGYHSGRPAVFCRLTGCNLWNGLEKDRDKAICKFCDTDFIGMDGENGGSYSAETLAKFIRSLWPDTSQAFIVMTGGEPMLQIDKPLIDTLHQYNIFISIETNGTIAVPDTIDWICVSPKANAELKQFQGNELKLVYPQKENIPEQFERLHFDHFYLQPLQNENWEANVAECIEFVKQKPKWNLSFQTHKYLNIP